MRQGLKRVVRRRDDALTEVRWDRLEHLLAAYHREAGITDNGVRFTYPLGRESAPLPGLEGRWGPAGCDNVTR